MTYLPFLKDVKIMTKQDQTFMVHDPLIMTDWSCCQGMLLSTAWLVVKPCGQATNRSLLWPAILQRDMEKPILFPLNSLTANPWVFLQLQTLANFLSGSEKSHPRCFTRKAGNKPWTTDPKTQTPTHGLSGVRGQKVTGIIHNNPQHLLCRRMTDTSLQCSVLKHSQKGHLSW